MTNRATAHKQLQTEHHCENQVRSMHAHAAERPGPIGPTRPDVRDERRTSVNALPITLDQTG